MNWLMSGQTLHAAIQNMHLSWTVHHQFSCLTLPLGRAVPPRPIRAATFAKLTRADRSRVCIPDEAMTTRVKGVWLERQSVQSQSGVLPAQQQMCINLQILLTTSFVLRVRVSVRATKVACILRHHGHSAPQAPLCCGILTGQGVAQGGRMSEAKMWSWQQAGSTVFLTVKLQL